MLAILFKGVDCHNGEIRIIFRIGGKIEVNHLLHHFIVGEGGSAHLREDRGSIHAKGHVADNFSDHISSFLAVVLVYDAVERTG